MLLSLFKICILITTIAIPFSKCFNILKEVSKKKLKQRIFITAIVVSLLTSVPVFASTWTKVLGAGKVVALKSGNIHNTRYDATNSNRSGCANTLAVDAGYSYSECAYLKSTNTGITGVEAPNGHYHVYATFNGMQPAPSNHRKLIKWDIRDFPKEY